MIIPIGGAKDSNGDFQCSHLHKGIQDVLVDVFFEDFLAKSLCNQ